MIYLLYHPSPVLFFHSAFLAPLIHSSHSALLFKFPNIPCANEYIHMCPYNYFFMYIYSINNNFAQENQYSYTHNTNKHRPHMYTEEDVALDTL